MKSPLWVGSLSVFTGTSWSIGNSSHTQKNPQNKTIEIQAPFCILLKSENLATESTTGFEDSQTIKYRTYVPKPGL